jgi:hypothetical protein
MPEIGIIFEKVEATWADVTPFVDINLEPPAPLVTYSDEITEWEKEILTHMIRHGKIDDCRYLYTKRTDVVVLANQAEYQSLYGRTMITETDHYVFTKTTIQATGMLQQTLFINQPTSRKQPINNFE